MRDETAVSSPSAALITETRLESLLRQGRATPRFLQGVYPFAGRSVFDLAPLYEELLYVVPAAHSAQIVYFRAGNLADDLIYLTLSANDVPVRYFPVGPKSDFHVPLAIVETYAAGTRLQVCFAAPRGLTGAVILDVGIVEIAEASDSGTQIIKVSDAEGEIAKAGDAVPEGSERP